MYKAFLTFRLRIYEISFIEIHLSNVISLGVNGSRRESTNDDNKDIFFFLRMYWIVHLTTRGLQSILSDASLCRVSSFAYSIDAGGSQLLHYNNYAPAPAVRRW